MKLFIALSALMALASAYPTNSGYAAANTNTNNNYDQQQQYKQIPIVKYESEQDKHSYRYGYESGNGIVAAEQGQLKNAGQKGHEVMVAEGYFSYPGKDGKTYSVKYIADENGFRAVGDHLPTPPPIPAELQEALAKIAAQSQQSYEKYDDSNDNNGNDGQYNEVQTAAHQKTSRRSNKW